MNMKSKLMAAIAMLLVSTIMMTTASFAWFTISTAPEISNVKASAAANGTLEIALNSTGSAPGEAALGDTGDNTKWGNLIDLADVMPTVTLKPVSVSEAGAVTIPSFGLDGRLKASTVAATEAGKGLVEFRDAQGTTWAIGIDFWMRSNQGGAVTLITDAGTDRGAGENGLGSYLTSNAAVKLAILVDGAVVHNAGTLPTGTITTLAANTAVKVRVILYMDGAGMTNADFKNQVEDVALNLQFTIAGLNGMGVQGEGNGRTTPATGDDTQEGETT